MKKWLIQGSVIFALITVGYLGYCQLLHSNLLPFATSHPHSTLKHRDTLCHLLTVGLLPIYIALILFGIGVISFRIYHFMQRFLNLKS